MNELQKLGYKRGEVTKNTYIYTDKQGNLSGMEKRNTDTFPADEGAPGYYPSAIWVDSAGMDMCHAYNKGKI